MRVAHHHVRPGVDDLTVVNAEPAAGDGYTDAVGILQRQVRRQVSHPSGGFGLAVHDVEIPGLPLGQASVLLHPLRSHPASSLRHPAQRWQRLAAIEAHLVQQVEGMWDAGQRGHPRCPRKVPETVVHHAFVGRHDGSPHREVAGQHGQPVTVGERQACDGAIVGGQLQILPDRDGVADDGVRVQAHQFWRSRGARRTEQQGQLRVDGGDPTRAAQFAVAHHTLRLVLPQNLGTTFVKHQQGVTAT